MEKTLFIDYRDCCGCGVCENVCKFDAIHMKEDENGFLYPSINSEKCVNCKACEKHCPVACHDKILISQHHTENYAAYIKDKEELLQSASGGVAASLAKAVINKGGVVFGVSYADAFRKAETVKISTIEDLIRIKDSKYMQSAKGSIYQEVKAELEKGTMVLYTGTPCEIGALKTFLSKEYENLYTCEIICHGPTTYKVAEKFLSEQEKTEKSKIVNMSVRSKDKGWKVPHIKLQFENGKSIIEKFYGSDYGFGFTVLERESCHHCIYKGDGKVADLTVGDFWGADEKDDFWNPDGISGINVHTEQGKKLLSMATDLALFPVSYEKILEKNQFLEKSVSYNKMQRLFSIGLRKIGLHKTVGIYRKYLTYKSKLKKIVR